MKEQYTCITWRHMQLKLLWVVSAVRKGLKFQFSYNNLLVPLKEKIVVFLEIFDYSSISNLPVSQVFIGTLCIDCISIELRFISFLVLREEY